MEKEVDDEKKRSAMMGPGKIHSQRKSQSP